MSAEPPAQNAGHVSAERNLIDVARREAAAMRGSESVTMPLLPDKDAFPGYDILRELRRGGQGVVYEAFQRSTSRKVAIKVMLGGPVATEAARVRFQREIRLLANLRHPNIVVIHDGGVSQCHAYFVMDFISGEHLHQYCRSRSLEAVRTIALFRQVLDAVAFAHKNGVVHRDLKPSNIIVDENETPFVLDFGLAKVVGGIHAEPVTALSKTGELLGTFRYMSPEQLTGDPDSVDARTDVHALGIILFELLTGSHPHELRVNRLDAAERIRQTEPPRVSKLRSDLGPELERIVLKAMSNDPGRRYPSAAEMMQDMDLWLNSRGQPLISGDQAGQGVARAWPLLRGRWSLVAGLAILFCGVWAVGHTMWGKNGRVQLVSAGRLGDPGQSTEGAVPSTAPHPSSVGPDGQQSVILDYVRKNLPLKSLHIGPIPGGAGIRIDGWVLNNEELTTLKDRVRPVKDHLQLEVKVNPEAVRLAVQRSMEAGARQVKVRLEGPSGSEHLNIELSRTESEAALTERARSFVLDSSLVRLRGY